MKVRVFGSFRGMSAKAIDGIDVVIVDVLRATTTITYALSRGASVVPLADEAIARERAAALGDRAILVGEHMGTRLPGFHCNNSPTELAAFDLDGKTVVICTTNGTKAIAACASAQRIFAGALTNAPALARVLATNGSLQRDVAIVCAGRNTGALAFEDLLGAGALAAAISVEDPTAWLADGARLARDVFVQHQGDLAAAVRSSDAAQELVDKGHTDDVEHAARYDAYTVAPLLRGDTFAAT